MSCISGGKLWRSRMLQPASFLESLYLVVFEARLQCGKLKKCLLWVCVIFMGMLCFLTGAATVNERLEQRTLKKNNCGMCLGCSIIEHLFLIMRLTVKDLSV